MRRFGIAAFLALTLLVGVVSVVAYNLGVSAGTTDAAIAAGASVIYAPSTFSPLGLIIGAFFVVMLIGFIARAVGGPGRHMGPGGRHRGDWGPGGRHRGDWDHETVPEPFRPMLERWHRDAHAEGTASKPDDESGTSSASAPTGQPAA